MKEITGYGNVLRGLLDERARDAEGLSEAERKERDFTHKKEALKYKMFFDRVWREMILHLDYGKIYPGFSTRHIREAMSLFTSEQIYSSKGFPTSDIRNEAHPHHDEWKKFCQRCEVDGMVPTVQYEHDGMGTDSWYVVNVKPKW